jgi:hypothetical protein
MRETAILSGERNVTIASRVIGEVETLNEPRRVPEWSTSLQRIQCMGIISAPDGTSSSALAAGNAPAPGVTIGFGRRGSNTAPGSPF